MIGVYNTIQLNGVELFRPNDFAPKREDIYGAEITTCSGKVIADRVGWRYADMTLNWDTLPQAQLDVLLKMGCPYAQGYYYDQPLPAQVFEEKYLRGGIPVERQETRKEDCI